MTQKTKNIIGWVLTGLLAFVFIGSAIMKFVGGEEVIKGMADIGLTPATVRLIGVVELLSILLFIIPRTGLLGTLLLTAYLGGAIATHLEHQQPVLPVALIESVLWITAVIRFPELTRRLMGGNVVS